MLLRTLLLGFAGIAALYFIGVPLWKLVKIYFYQIRDPLKLAQARHERARKESAAADLDKKTEQVYDKMYQDKAPSDETEETPK